MSSDGGLGPSFLLEAQKKHAAHLKTLTPERLDASFSWKNLKGELSKEYFTPVDIGALYWHLVDLVWIYLFPLLYLVGKPE